MTVEADTKKRQVTPTGTKMPNMDIKSVPTAITKKSSRGMISMKTSNRIAMHNSNSFKSSKLTGAKRDQVKKLNSFNTDLLEVADLQELKASCKNSGKNSPRNKARPRSTL